MKQTFVESFFLLLGKRKERKKNLTRISSRIAQENIYRDAKVVVEYITLYNYYSTKKLSPFLWRESERCSIEAKLKLRANKNEQFNNT